MSNFSVQLWVGNWQVFLMVLAACFFYYLFLWHVSFFPIHFSSFVMSRNKLKHFFLQDCTQHCAWKRGEDSKWASWKVGVIVAIATFFHAPKFAPLRWKSATASPNDAAAPSIWEKWKKTCLSEKLLGSQRRRIYTIYSIFLQEFMAW